MTPPDPFLRALRGLVRPLIRTLIARGVTAPAFYRLLKSVYVEVAHEQFRIDGAPPTDSRIGLLTGVHRRDVRAILEAGDGGWAASRGRASVFATVLSRWMTAAEYQDDDGPRPLPRRAEDGIDFETLVTGISRDIRPRTVLDELLRQGLVTDDADGLLRVTARAQAGPVSDDDRLVFFAANVGDHLAAAAGNLMAEGEPPFLERAVFYSRLTPAATDAIEARARDGAQALLTEINALSAEAQTAGRLEPDNAERYRFGVYLYRERPEPGPENGHEPD